MKIRPAEIDDAEAIRNIYNPYVVDSTATFDLIPRTLEQQQDWIKDRSGARFILVAEDDEGTVRGFASISQYRDRPAYSPTVENSIYVDQSFVGRGLGRSLMEELIETARSHGFHSMIAKIVEGQDASVALHQSCGFEIIGHEHEVGRKFGRWLDVLTLQRML
ncbi:MAG: N-acetyltransferase family protein [Microthrixaceae bacterium]